MSATWESHLQKLRYGTILMTLILGSLTFLEVQAESDYLIEFPFGIKQLTYEIMEKYSYSYLGRAAYSFEYHELLYYNVIDVNKVENTYTVEFTNEISLINYDGIVPIGADFTYKNGTISRKPFTKNRNLKIQAIRIVDEFDGKVLSILNEDQVPNEVSFIYRYSDDNKEIDFLITSGVANIGHTTFVWKDKYEDIEGDIVMMSTPAGTFSCIKHEEVDTDSEYLVFYTSHYSEHGSGITILNNYTTIQNEYWDTLGLDTRYERVYKLTNIDYGKTWDIIKIIDGGVSNPETKVKESETVWFKAEYAFDSEVFDGSKGILYVNNDPMEWSDTNQRWEKTYSSDTKKSQTFTISDVHDDKYGLTQFDDVAGIQSIEWKPREIPGFSIASLVLGLALSFSILKNRAYSR